jgi:hypothetical protein
MRPRRAPGFPSNTWQTDTTPARLAFLSQNRRAPRSKTPAPWLRHVTTPPLLPSRTLPPSLLSVHAPVHREPASPRINLGTPICALSSPPEPPPTPTTPHGRRQPVSFLASRAHRRASPRTPRVAVGLPSLLSTVPSLSVPCLSLSGDPNTAPFLSRIPPGRRLRRAPSPSSTCWCRDRPRPRARPRPRRRPAACMRTAPCLGVPPATAAPS